MIPGGSYVHKPMIKFLRAPDFVFLKILTGSDKTIYKAFRILATADTVLRRRGPFCPRLRMRRMNSLVTHLTNSFWLP